MKFIAEVVWVSPASGRVAPQDKMLALDESITKDTGYTDFSFDTGFERYTFPTWEAATAFRLRVKALYDRNPQYFVVNDEGNETETVAWVPNVSVSKADEAAFD